MLDPYEAKSTILGLVAKPGIVERLKVSVLILGVGFLLGLGVATSGKPVRSVLTTPSWVWVVELNLPVSTQTIK